MCCIEDPCCNFAHMDLMDTMVLLHCCDGIVSWKQSIEEIAWSTWVSLREAYLDLQVYEMIKGHP